MEAEKLARTIVGLLDPANVWSFLHRNSLLSQADFERHLRGAITFKDYVKLISDLEPNHKTRLSDEQFVASLPRIISGSWQQRALQANAQRDDLKALYHAISPGKRQKVLFDQIASNVEVLLQLAVTPSAHDNANKSQQAQQKLPRDSGIPSAQSLPTPKPVTRPLAARQTEDKAHAASTPVRDGPNQHVDSSNAKGRSDLQPQEASDKVHVQTSSRRLRRARKRSHIFAGKKRDRDDSSDTQQPSSPGCKRRRVEDDLERHVPTEENCVEEPSSINRPTVLNDRDQTVKPDDTPGLDSAMTVAFQTTTASSTRDESARLRKATPQRDVSPGRPLKAVEGAENQHFPAQTLPDNAQSESVTPGVAERAAKKVAKKAAKREKKLLEASNTQSHSAIPIETDAATAHTAKSDEVSAAIQLPEGDGIKATPPAKTASRSRKRTNLAAETLASASTADRDHQCVNGTEIKTTKQKSPIKSLSLIDSPMALQAHKLSSVERPDPSDAETSTPNVRKTALATVSHQADLVRSINSPAERELSPTRPSPRHLAEENALGKPKSQHLSTRTSSTPVAGTITAAESDIPKSSNPVDSASKSARHPAKGHAIVEAKQFSTETPHLLLKSQASADIMAAMRKFDKFAKYGDENHPTDSEDSAEDDESSSSDDNNDVGEISRLLDATARSHHSHSERGMHPLQPDSKNAVLDQDAVNDGPDMIGTFAQIACSASPSQQESDTQSDGVLSSIDGRDTSEPPQASENGEAKLVTPERDNSTAEVDMSGVSRAISELLEDTEVPASKRKRRTFPKTSAYFEHETSPVKRRRVAAGTSAIIFPSTNATRFGLIQEELADNPFRLVLVTTFLNKTAGRVAVPIFRELMEHYPTPEDLAQADVEHVSGIIYRLGFQNQRAKTVIKLARAWVDCPPERTVRYRTRNYPQPGDGADLKPTEVVHEDADECAGALEIGHLPGCGPYAYDSWRIFCRDELREAGSGTGHEDADRPEWTRVLPTDKELRAYLRWMWLRQGFVWDPLTGERRQANSEELEAAVIGDVEISSPSKGVTQTVSTSPAVSQIENAIDTLSAPHKESALADHAEPALSRPPSCRTESTPPREQIAHNTRRRSSRHHHPAVVGLPILNEDGSANVIESDSGRSTSGDASPTSMRSGSAAVITRDRDATRLTETKSPGGVVLEADLQCADAGSTADPDHGLVSTTEDQRTPNETPLRHRTRSTSQTTTSRVIEVAESDLEEDDGVRSSRRVESHAAFQDTQDEYDVESTSSVSKSDDETSDEEFYDMPRGASEEL